MIPANEQKINPSLEIARLTHYGLQTGLIEPSDVPYVRNRLLALLHLDAFDACTAPEEALTSPAPILERLLTFAYQNGSLESNAAYSRDIFDTELMTVLTARPSEVIRRFWAQYAVSPEAATDWYYHFSRATNYIRTDRIARDLRWRYSSQYGDLVITINLSKPEKDPKAIAAADADRPAEKAEGLRLSALRALL